MSMLRVENIQKSFGKTEVLKNISFSLDKGDVVAIIGSSGSGKTTLLRCLNFLETPNRGKIIVNGKTLLDAGSGQKLSDSEKRKNRLHFGLVFQSFNLFPQYSVLDNIMLAPLLNAKDEMKKCGDKYEGCNCRKDIKERIRQDAMDLLERVGLTDKANNYPCQLSGGQQQRVASARALAQSPDVLCFDEPTSALDPELTDEVLRVIKELKDQGRTMLVVTHEMEFARNVADRVVFFADGMIEEDGTPEQLFTNPKSQKTAAFLNHGAANI